MNVHQKLKMLGYILTKEMPFAEHILLIKLRRKILTGMKTPERAH